ncbi:MAG: oligosaccharide flippase family protein [Pseudomonadota bacterium]
MRSLIYYAGFYGGAAAFLRLIGFLIFMWLGKSLSVSDFGNFGLLYAFQQALATFTLAGIVEAFSGMLGEKRCYERHQQLLAAATIAFFLMATAGALFGFIWILCFKSLDISLLTYVSVIGGGILLALSSFQAQLVRFEEKHSWSLLFSFCPPLGGIIGGAAAFFVGKTLSAFFMGSLLGEVIPLFIFWMNRIGFWYKNASLREVFHILSKAAPFMVIAFLGWLSGYGNNYVIKFFFQSIEVAKFTFALSLCSVMLLVAGALNQVWCPRFYRIIHQLPFQQVEDKNKSFYKILSVLLGLLGGAVIIAFPSVIKFFGGNLLLYQSLNIGLSFLFSGYIFLTPWWHCQNFFLANGMGQNLLKITLLTSFIGVAFLLGFMKFFGPIGIYLGFLFQMILRALGIVFVARQNWAINISWQGVIIGIGMVFSGLLISYFSTSVIISLVCYSISMVILAGIFLFNEFILLYKK